MKIGLICRCKDEYFVEEFVNYYINQGVDKLYIIDDDSTDKSIYDKLQTNKKVMLLFEKNIIANNTANTVYRSIRKKYDWIIYVDVDEFITTKRHPTHTLRQELESTFKYAHCVKVPWVMMSCNGLEKSPESILTTNIHRWNHDLRHPNPLPTQHKFRCRYDQIEVKCIFRPKFFKNLADHHPIDPFGNRPLNIVDSIKNKPSPLDPFYPNLREEHIATGYLLCYHYRIISAENCRKKVDTIWYTPYGYTAEDLMFTDYSEIIDTTLAEDKTIKQWPPENLLEKITFRLKSILGLGTK